MTIKEMPQPKTFGELKNLPLLNTDKPIQTLMKIADELGKSLNLKRLDV